MPPYSDLGIKIMSMSAARRERRDDDDRGTAQ
jgi:hypothetical protein